MRSPNFYTYAFINTPDFPVNLPEGNLGELRLISGNKLSAVVEPEISLEASQNNDEEIIKMVLAHDRVICELSRQMTVLPLRFGTYFISQETLLNHIESHGQEYQEKLNHIQGKNEYTLKVIPHKVEELAKQSGANGRDYFLAKKQHYQHQKSFIAAQNEEKSNLINFIKEIYQSSAIVQDHAEEVRLHLLVDHHDKALLLKQVLTLQKKCSHWNLILGEPLPPYHFI
ncbi:GvpL/GvpF family gas vesicle protein [Nostoc sp. CHAB 5836]|uniref:GvpL/GvpF family gas vesicle protein n=1 Tax=Nostoc sp. CHAB 5836 TaxID=2780404 RepID=UPI001E48A44C|nr:GvpL/GvpF family gas vesicle protein [Nostoc sp. CHAB 5836]MCC5617693.1 GvpL/GvpF family gas vesicle protein [Nostoc sp. CHAB 5836]